MSDPLYKLNQIAIAFEGDADTEETGWYMEARNDVNLTIGDVRFILAEVSRLGGELKEAQALLAYTQDARHDDIESARRKFMAILNDSPYESAAYQEAFDAVNWADIRRAVNLAAEVSPAPANEESER